MFVGAAGGERPVKTNAKEFDEIARTIFWPLYPVVAGQMLARRGRSAGTCLDIGCGGGYLGLELARRSLFHLRLLDQSSQMLAIAQANLAAYGLSGRGEVILADVEAMPLPEASIDLAISRGSVFFWPDLAAAFKEIWRVLAPGGLAQIGGGFGSAAIREAIGDKMRARNGGDDKWRAMVRRNLGPETRQKFTEALDEAGVAGAEIIDSEEEGLWVVLRKPA